MTLTITSGLKSQSSKQVNWLNTAVDPVDGELFVTSASKLKLSPGYWPTCLTSEVGNGKDFLLLRIRSDGSRLYEQVGGPCVLAVSKD